jgi:hypothetical protein
VAEGEGARRPDSSALANLSRRCDGRSSNASIMGQPEKMQRPGRRALVRPAPGRGSRSAFHMKSRLPRRSRDMRRRGASGFLGSYQARAERRLGHSSTAHSFSAPAPDDPQDAAPAEQARQGFPPHRGFPCKGVCQSAGPPRPHRSVPVSSLRDSRSASRTRREKSPAAIWLR